MYGLLRCNILQVFTRACRADVLLRDVTIARDGKRRLASENDVTHRKRAEDLGRFWKRQRVELRPASGEDGWLSLAGGDLCGGCHTCWGWGSRWKSQNRKIVPLYPYVEEPLNSKVIKKKVSYLNKEVVFFVFRDSYVLCDIFMDIRCTFHTKPYHGYGIVVDVTHCIFLQMKRWPCWSHFYA